MKALAALCAVLMLAACYGPPVDHWRQKETWRPLDIEAKPIPGGGRRFGALLFRGGVELNSSEPAFGGLSDLWVGADGRVVFVSDSGLWFEARLESGEDGAPRAIVQARTAVMRDERAQRSRRTSTRDAEGLARLKDGRFAVSYERVTRVLIHDLDANGPTAAGAPGPALLGLEELHGNTTLEAITQLQDGRLLIGAERDRQGYAPLWIASLDAQAPVAPVARMKLPFGYGLSGLAVLPDGDVVALLRAYTLVAGGYARLVRLDTDELERGVISATPLAQMRAAVLVDNFEGVAAVPLPDGGARLYLVSDDNYLDTQRTLLYAFDLTPRRRPRRASS